MIENFKAEPKKNAAPKIVYWFCHRVRFWLRNFFVPSTSTIRKNNKSPKKLLFQIRIHISKRPNLASFIVNHIDKTKWNQINYYWFGRFVVCYQVFFIPFFSLTLFLCCSWMIVEKTTSTQKVHTILFAHKIIINIINIIGRYFVIPFSAISFRPEGEKTNSKLTSQTIFIHKNAKHYKCDNKVHINYVFRYILHK